MGLRRLAAQRQQRHSTACQLRACCQRRTAPAWTAARTPHTWQARQRPPPARADLPRRAAAAGCAWRRARPCRTQTPLSVDTRRGVRRPGSTKGAQVLPLVGSGGQRQRWLSCHQAHGTRAARQLCPRQPPGACTATWKGQSHTWQLVVAGVVCEVKEVGVSQVRGLFVWLVVCLFVEASLAKAKNMQERNKTGSTQGLIGTYVANPGALPVASDSRSLSRIAAPDALCAEKATMGCWAATWENTNSSALRGSRFRGVQVSGGACASAVGRIVTATSRASTCELSSASLRTLQSTSGCCWFVGWLVGLILRVRFA